jgi:uroporphyrin-III C-methyltransferase / precorrin-2 dehydrogenase / sirohydrochlorin ferrochelatase
MTSTTSPASSRIAPLAVLPVFFRLAGRRVVVAGESEGAAWKVELLAQAGAHVALFAPSPCPRLAEIVASLGGSVTLERREWGEADLPGAALVVADVADDDEAALVAEAARAAGVPVNVVDKPAFCDFQFGSIVNRSPLVIGISTDGAAPVFGQAIRSRIETILPAGLQRWAEAAWAWRPLIQALSLPFQARRRVWEWFTREALRDPGKAPSASHRDAFVAMARDGGGPEAAGSVALVGAGPGDPELLTLKAVRLLQSADVILHDDLVSDAILDFARREAERIVVGKRGHRPSCKQNDINALMVDLARQGRRIVRLKGGDPLVFGRAGEEIAACRAAGIAVEVVPGITAALGAAASLGVSVTHRDHARRLQFVTAHSKEGRMPDDLDWGALADPAATTAVYMGKAVLGPFAQRLVEAGVHPATPAVIIENATRSDEVVLHATVSTMAATLVEAHLEGPCIMLIGAALGEAGRPSRSDVAVPPAARVRAPA